jgi:hypothetical protein
MRNLFVGCLLLPVVTACGGLSSPSERSTTPDATPTSASARGDASAPSRSSDAAIFGTTREQPIEVCRPQGEEEYLERLRCRSGVPPGYRRTGNVGPRNPYPTVSDEKARRRLFDQALEFKAPPPGVPDIHILDGYEVVCGAEKTTLYLDMYHCDVPPPPFAPAGFVLALDL